MSTLLPLFKIKPGYQYRAGYKYGRIGSAGYPDDENQRKVLKTQSAEKENSEKDY